MGIIERLRQQHADEDKKAAEEQLAIGNELTKRHEELVAERKPREDFVRSQFENINRATGVIDMLQEINDKYWGASKNPLSSTPAHGIIRTTKEEDVLQLELVWRGNSRLVVYKSPDSLASGYGYHRVTVVINPDLESITIKGQDDKFISKDEWSKDKKIIEDTLINAFENPWDAGEVPQSGWF